MAFEYDVKFYRGPEHEFDFPGLRDGASMWCAGKEQAASVALAFNGWAFRQRSPLIASALPVSPSDPKPKGWRVWIAVNESGPDAYGIDAVKEWAALRIATTGQEPAEGWPRTAELYRDFTAWAKARGLSASFLPPINTFTQRAKTHIAAKFVRRADGMHVIGAALKKTDMEAANGIDREPL